MQQPESLPRIVDRYELVSVLGSGGFATVYRARHVHTQQAVAVKIIMNRSGIDRWLGEARAAAAVQHRNVVRVLDCGQSGDDVFIVMDLVEGPTLADVLAQYGALPPARAVGIAVQILDGLSAAHARSIVHRDIKPPNILVTRDVDGTDFPKILDFGVSKQLTEISGTLDGTAIGTPGYMAPELFGGARYADPRVDIYAVAATLYEMLAGRLPFGARTYEELVVQVATTRPAPLAQVAANVPSPIAAAVDRGLARDREARWQTADQFASALRGALVGITAPSSHAFEATLDASSQNVARTPPVPTLGMPDPSTLRTAPPPVVSTANRNETRSGGALTWVVVALGLVLFAGAGGAMVVWRVMKAQAPTAAVAAATSPVTTSAPREGDHTLDDVSTAPTPTEGVTATPAQATTAIAKAGGHAPASLTGGAGVKFTFPPEIVGGVKAGAVYSLATYILPQSQRCRPDHGNPPILARVQLLIHEDGTIAIAQPSPSDPGDVPAAKCLAAIFRDNASAKTFQPGSSGIATIEAKLDPR